MAIRQITEHINDGKVKIGPNHETLKRWNLHSVQALLPFFSGWLAALCSFFSE